jgi:hypothetical protein
VSSGRKRVISRSLAGLSALAIVVAIFAYYCEDALFDSRSFSDHAVSVLDDPEVQQLLTEAIADTAIEGVPNAVAARPLIESVAAGLVGSGALQSVVRSGVEDLHRTVVLGSEDTVTVTLENVGTLLRSGLATASPQLAEEISRKLDVDLFAADEPTPPIVIDALQLQQNIKVLTLASLLVALLAGAGAIATAATRLIGLRRLGRAIAGGALVALVVWFVGRTVLAGGFEGDARVASRAIYNAFLGDLRTWLLILAGGGMVLTAGISTTREPIDVGGLLTRGWAHALATPSRTSLRVLRALLLIVVGVAIVSNRDLAVDLAALAIGAFIVYVGAAELMRLAAGAVRTDRATDAAREELEADLSGGALARIAGVGVLLVGGFVALGFFTNDEESAPLQVDTCNGYIELCDRPLDEVAFAATHNSMSAATYDNWFFAQQEKGITQQLNDGIRALLIDPHYGVETPQGVATDLQNDEGSRQKIEAGLGEQGVAAAEALRRQIGFDGNGEREIFLCHAFCEVGAIRFSEGLREIRDFLAANPGEIVVLSLEDATSPEETSMAIEDAGLGPYLYEGPNGPPWPTMRELIDSNQRLVVMAERDGGTPEWYRRQFLITQETPYRFTRTEELTRPSSCDPNRGRSDAGFFLLNHWVDTSPAPRQTNAKIVNARQFLLDRIQMCEEIRDAQPNLIAVDFYKEGDVLEVVDELNGVG